MILVQILTRKSPEVLEGKVGVVAAVAVAVAVAAAEVAVEAMADVEA